MRDSGVAQVLEFADALIGLFEHCSQPGPELCTRPSSPRGAIIPSHRIGRPSELAGGFCGFARARKLTAERTDRQREQARTLDQVVRRHAKLKCTRHAGQNSETFRLFPLPSRSSGNLNLFHFFYFLHFLYFLYFLHFRLPFLPFAVTFPRCRCFPP